MLNLFVTPEAELDLETIYEYTFYNRGQIQADKYQDDLFDAMSQMQHNGEIGSKYIHADLDYRKLLMNRHLIFYRVDNNDCVVVRILHERMNLLFELED
jgi:toxin ParE1/3/4